MPWTWFIQVNVFMLMIFIYTAFLIMISKDRTEPGPYPPTHRHRVGDHLENTEQG